MLRFVWQLQRDSYFVLCLLEHVASYLQICIMVLIAAGALDIMSAFQYQERGIQEGQRALLPAKSAPRAIFQEILYQLPLISHWPELSNVVPSSYK